MLARIMRGSSADCLEQIIETLLPDAATAIDLTWGSGKFWTPRMLQRWDVTGIDLDPDRARDRCADFRELPYQDGSFDIAVFDPPYQTDAGRDAFISARFGSYCSVDEMRIAVMQGVAEAARVSRIGYICKVMDHVHGNRLVEMTGWVRTAAPHELYDFCLLESPSKSENRRWTKNGGPMSVRSTATTWMVFRHDGPIHRRHKPADRVTPREAVSRFRRLRPV